MVTKMISVYIFIHLFVFRSANINDRSMLGDRDSELAVCVKDDNKTVSIPTKFIVKHFVRDYLYL